jgi:hypothetical protein
MKVSKLLWLIKYILIIFLLKNLAPSESLYLSGLSTIDALHKKIRGDIHVHILNLIELS